MPERPVGRLAQVAGLTKAAPLGQAVLWRPAEPSQQAEHQAWRALVQPEAYRLQVARLVVRPLPLAAPHRAAAQQPADWNAQLAPRAGDHTFSGGLYRDVVLVVTDPLHVTWYGTFVTTPTVSASSATVNIKTEIRNDYAASKNCILKTDIVDGKGVTVATVSSTQAVAANSTVTIEQTTPAIANPSLWHPDHPTLYRAVSTISEG